MPNQDMLPQKLYCVPTHDCDEHNNSEREGEDSDLPKITSTIVLLRNAAK